MSYSFVIWFPEHVTPNQLQGSESRLFQLDKAKNGSSKIDSLNEFKARTARIKNWVKQIECFLLTIKIKIKTANLQLVERRHKRVERTLK